MNCRQILSLSAVLGIVLMAVVGCASVDVASMHYLSAPVYSPTAPGSIQILNVEPKTPFQRIGEIQLTGTTDPSPADTEVEKKLRIAAGKLGADAVLVTADRIQTNGVEGFGYRRFGGSTMLTSGRKVMAIAIKFAPPSS